MDSLQITPLCSNKVKSNAGSFVIRNAFLVWALTGLSLKSIAQGQSRPALLPLGIHREPALNGWIPGQWSWPSTPPRPDLKWSTAVAGRYHPAIPSLQEITFAASYASLQNWLTFGITQNGSPPLRRYKVNLGYSKSMSRNRSGISLEWNRLSSHNIQSQSVAATLGSEQALGKQWRIGLTLQHPMILQTISISETNLDQREEPVHGLGLSLFMMMKSDPWIIHGATHFSRIEGLRLETGFIYRRKSGLGMVFSTDPVNTVMKFGLCYLRDNTTVWASTMDSPLPGLSYQAAWEGGRPRK